MTDEVQSPAVVHPPTQEQLSEQVRRDRAKADRVTLMGWLTKLDALYQRGGILISRDRNTMTWEQTGFATRDGKLIVKVGSQPYQPMGLIDDTYFYQSDVSKLIWIREFALVQPDTVRYMPAFLVEAGTTPVVDDQLLTERNRTALESAFKDIGEELVKLTSAIAEGELRAIKEAEFKLVETVKLAAISSPNIDGRLRKLAIDDTRVATFDANGHVNGFDFTKMEALMIGRAVSEFARMLLNEDGIRRFVKTSELKPANGGSELEIVVAVLSQLEALVAALVPVEGEEDGRKFNDVEAERQLNNAQTTLPELRAALTPFYESTDLLGATKAAIEALKVMRDKLTPPA